MKNQNLIIGTARYIGSNPALQKEFGDEPTTLYNSEGNFVLDSNDKQILTNPRTWKEMLNKKSVVHNPHIKQ